MSEKKLSLREFATEVIKKRGSIFLTVNGQRKQFSMKNFNELPSDAELAAGNPAAEAQAVEDIDAEIKRLEAQKKTLTVAKKATEEVTEEEKPKASAKKEDK